MNRNIVSKAMILAATTAMAKANSRRKENDRDIVSKAMHEFEDTYHMYAESPMVQKIAYRIVSGFGSNLEYEIINGEHKLVFDSKIFEEGSVTENIIVTISNIRKMVSIEFEQKIGDSVIEWKGEIIRDVNADRTSIHITADGMFAAASAVPSEIKNFILELLHAGRNPVKKSEFSMSAFILACIIIAESPRRNVRNTAEKMENLRKEKFAKEDKQRTSELEAEVAKLVEARKKELFKNTVSIGTFNEVKSELEKAREELENTKKELEALKAAAQKPEADFLPTEKAPSPAKKKTTKKTNNV